jgi:hypothetical protein
MDYDIRKGHAAKIEGDGLKNLMIEVYGSAREQDCFVVSSCGAMTMLKAKMLTKNALEVSIETDKSAAPDVHMDTVKKWNIFLERATGFTSKERSKRLQKKAKEGKL